MRGPLLLLPLALMGCSQEQQQGAGHAHHAGPAAEQLPAAASPAAQPVPTGTPITAMPAAMRGRWGMTANDCDPARSDAKGLLQVGADNLRFYESRATLQSAASIGPDAVRATFSYTGEGMQWSAEDTFRLLNNGEVLVRRSTGAEPTEPFEYRRCP